MRSASASYTANRRSAISAPTLPGVGSPAASPRARHSGTRAIQSSPNSKRLAVAWYSSSGWRTRSTVCSNSAPCSCCTTSTIGVRAWSHELGKSRLRPNVRATAMAAARTTIASTALPKNFWPCFFCCLARIWAARTAAGSGGAGTDVTGAAIAGRGGGAGGRFGNVGTAGSNGIPPPGGKVVDCPPKDPSVGPTAGPTVGTLIGSDGPDGVDGGVDGGEVAGAERADGSEGVMAVAVGRSSASSNTEWLGATYDRGAGSGDGSAGRGAGSWRTAG